MKTIFLFLATATLAFSQTDTSRQLKESIEKHDAAILAALEPVHKRHVEEIKVILAKATRAGDLETAVKAKEQLLKYGVTMSPSGNISEATLAPQAKLAAQLKGTVWQHSSVKSNKVTLHPDGSTTASWHGKTQKWKVTGAATMEMSYTNSGNSVEFTVDPSVSMLTTSKDKFIRIAN